MTAGGDSLWYKDAIVYQLHVRAFCDSNNDGIGDFPGLMQKLHYLQELGVNTLWLMPFFPSPLRDDGYDISDYTAIHHDYGSLENFKAFLNAAHDRGIRIIIELVLNHTSDQHPWFKEARSSRENPKRDWYVWNETDTRYREASIIFLDTETSNWAWDPISKSYYWHRFFSHQQTELRQPRRGRGDVGRDEILAGHWCGWVSVGCGPLSRRTQWHAV